MSLWAEFLNHSGRVAHKWTQYFPVYERHLARFRNQPITMLEIGCGKGGSLQLWKKYLGPSARILGIDINPKCKEFEEPQINVRIGSQDDTVFLQSLIDEFGHFDVVLDDGSHIMRHMVATFNFLYPRTNIMGVYMIEDLHACYSDRYGGGLEQEGTFIELMKGFIDELHADYIKQRAPSDFTRSTMSMHVYDSIVAFERGRHDKATHFRIGGQAISQASKPAAPAPT